MARSVIIPDDLAELLEQRRREEGLSTLDDAAEQVIRQGLSEPDAFPYTAQELRELIAEADASPAESWDAKAFREDVMREYASHKGG